MKQGRQSSGPRGRNGPEIPGAPLLQVLLLCVCNSFGWTDINKSSACMCHCRTDIRRVMLPDLGRGYIVGASSIHCAILVRICSTIQNITPHTCLRLLPFDVMGDAG